MKIFSNQYYNDARRIKSNNKWFLRTSNEQRTCVNGVFLADFGTLHSLISPKELQ